MSKTYDYKSLVDIYVSIPHQDWIHSDFRNYREALVAKLEELLDIRIRASSYSTPFNEKVFPYNSIYAGDMWRMFDATVENLRKDLGVFGSYLMGSPRVALIEMREENPTEFLAQIMKTTSKLYDLHETINKERYQLLYQLIELFFGKIDKVITSAELLAAGFDDSKEPQIRDYRNYI